ncbi:thrombospondin type 3 repeat-containing protein [Candidatus Pyrohabitans sp.]
MARKQRRKAKKPRVSPQLAALFGVGIMIISSLAYAVLYNPFAGEPQKEAGGVAPLPPGTFPAPQSEQGLTPDTDGDGIADALEAEIGTDPLVKDTPASLEARREEAYQEYMEGKITLEAYSELSRKLEKAEEMLGQ